MATDRLGDERTGKTIDVVEKVLLTVAIIGALNWGLIGFFNFNLVDAIFGGGDAEETSMASRVIYAIVGVAGLVALAFLPQMRARARYGEGSLARVG